MNSKEISETNEKVLKAILEDKDDTIGGVVRVIKNVWDKNTISELIFLLLDKDDELIQMIQRWNLERMKK